jgi:hypothetical protein
LERSPFRGNPCACHFFLPAPAKPRHAANRCTDRRCSDSERNIRPPYNVFSFRWHLRLKIFVKLHAGEFAAWLTPVPSSIYKLGQDIFWSARDEVWTPGPAAAAFPLSRPYPNAGRSRGSRLSPAQSCAWREFSRYKPPFTASRTSPAVPPLLGCSTTPQQFRHFDPGDAEAVRIRYMSVDTERVAVSELDRIRLQCLTLTGSASASTSRAPARGRAADV